MSVNHEGKQINAPGNVVITGYSPCFDINIGVTPDFKKFGSTLLYIDISDAKMRLGGSVLFIQFNILGNKQDVPKLDIPIKLKYCFNVIQKLIAQKKILSLHDISDGGLITTLIEMSISSGIGADIQIPIPTNYSKRFKNEVEYINRYLFSEELGIVIEIETKYLEELQSILSLSELNSKIIGKTTNYKNFVVKKRVITNNSIQDIPLYNVELNYLVKLWENTSYNLEKRQTNIKCVEQEYKVLQTMEKPLYYLPEKLENFCFNSFNIDSITFNISSSILQSENYFNNVSENNLNAGIIRMMEVMVIKK